MKTFKEFRMPPVTMGRDNTIVGVRETDLEEGPLVMDDMAMVKAILNKIEDDIGKLNIKKKLEQAWPKVQLLAKMAGYKVTKAGQEKGRMFRSDIKK